MNQQTFFEKVISVLEKIDAPYMITGSVGAMLYGVKLLDSKASTLSGLGKSPEIII